MLKPPLRFRCPVKGVAASIPGPNVEILTPTATVENGRVVASSAAAANGTDKRNNNVAHFKERSFIDFLSSLMVSYRSPANFATRQAAGERGAFRRLSMKETASDCRSDMSKNAGR